VHLSPEETRRLLIDLEPDASRELDRHLAAAKDWFPHEYVPWSQGRTFDGLLGGEPWAPGDSSIPDEVRTSLIVNLLTEDNLPSYHHEIAVSFGRDGAWGTWVHRWTAEEDRHGQVLRDYLTVTRAVDPVALEQARMLHMSVGFANDYDTMLHSLAYVSFQELATRISHRNTGVASKEPVCEQMMARIAADENLHMIFYRNMLGAAFEREPNLTMQAVRDVALARGLHPQIGADRQRRHLRPAAAPRPGARPGAAAVAGLGPRGSRRRGGEGAHRALRVPRHARRRGDAVRGTPRRAQRTDRGARRLTAQVTRPSSSLRRPPRRASPPASG